MSITCKVGLESRVVKTTVVKTIAQLDQSLRELLVSISQNVRGNTCKCVVGLGVEKEFRPSSSADGVGGNHQVSERVAILKLCYGTSCLIIQLLQLKTAPCSLSNFLQLRGLSFVGVGIRHCLEALERDYGIKCRNAVDLGQLASAIKEKEVYKGYGLLDLVKELCFSDVKKHLMDSFTATALSNWGVTTLSQKQIEAATSDAFICFYLGNDLFGGYIGSTPF
ncbi:Werner Syndrome-like exonuclease [Chenopodium quinoa]|uniref:3'-5' exonuclease domain-containing protein n=1 Tax=Chenopodium quinoa TaxID=63459 RepID=A0A803M7E9_CHEQI|nr:Werner Syndrome-like exonuclease [Chenopodium quinoa]